MKAVVPRAPLSLSADSAGRHLRSHRLTARPSLKGPRRIEHHHHHPQARGHRSRFWRTDLRRELPRLAFATRSALARTAFALMAGSFRLAPIGFLQFHANLPEHASHAFTFACSNHRVHCCPVGPTGRRAQGPRGAVSRPCTERTEAWPSHSFGSIIRRARASRRGGGKREMVQKL